MNIGLIQPLNEKKYFYAIFASILAAVLLMAGIGPSLLAAATDDDDTEVLFFDLETRFVSGIEGHIILIDTGSETKYFGTATGMTQFENYFSLIYDVESPVDGPFACDPGIFDPNDPRALTDAQMFIGIWLPVESEDVRTLVMFNDIAVSPPPPDLVGPVAEKSGIFYTPIDNMATMSIRGENFGGAFNFGVTACGLIDSDDDDSS